MPQASRIWSSRTHSHFSPGLLQNPARVRRTSVNPQDNRPPLLQPAPYLLLEGYRAFLGRLCLSSQIVPRGQEAVRTVMWTSSETLLWGAVDYACPASDQVWAVIVVGTEGQAPINFWKLDRSWLEDFPIGFSYLDVP